MILALNPSKSLSVKKRRYAPIIPLSSDEAVISEVLGESELYVTQVDYVEGEWPSVDVNYGDDKSDLKDKLIHVGICRQVGQFFFCIN